MWVDVPRTLYGRLDFVLISCIHCEHFFLQGKTYLIAVTKYWIESIGWAECSDATEVKKYWKVNSNQSACECESVSIKDKIRKLCWQRLEWFRNRLNIESAVVEQIFHSQLHNYKRQWLVECRWPSRNTASFEAFQRRLKIGRCARLKRFGEKCENAKLQVKWRIGVTTLISSNFIQYFKPTNGPDNSWEINSHTIKCNLLYQNLWTFLIQENLSYNGLFSVIMNNDFK